MTSLDGRVHVVLAEIKRVRALIENQGIYVHDSSSGDDSVKQAPFASTVDLTKFTETDWAIIAHAAALMEQQRQKKPQVSPDDALVSYAANDPVFEHTPSTVDYFTAMKNVARGRYGPGSMALVRNLFKRESCGKCETATAITYSRVGVDFVSHNMYVGPKKRKHSAISFVGVSGLLEQLNEAQAITNALFGTEDVRDVLAVIGSISGRAPYLLRRDVKPPSETEEKVFLGFDNAGYWFDIYAGLPTRTLRNHFQEVVK